MAAVWSSKDDLDPPGLNQDRYHRRYVLHTDRDSTYSADARSASPDRRPRHHSRDTSPSRRYRPASYTRRDGFATGDEDNTDDNGRHCHQCNIGAGRVGERGWGESRHLPERRNEDARRGKSGSLQGVSSFLQRLGIIDDDPFVESVGEHKYEIRRRPQTPYRGHNPRHSRRTDQDSSIRSRSPVSSPALSPSRSPPRRRAVSPFSDYVAATAVFTKHDGGRGRSLDPNRDRDGYDRRGGDHDYHYHKRKVQPSRARSIPERSDGHNRTRRGPSLKRGSPSSSSTASSTSSSRSDPSSSSSKWESAARNALRAGTMAALSSHGAPGSWLGNKGTRVATAALGAALVDTYMGHRHPDSFNGIRHTAMRQAAEYAINSIVAEPIMHRATRRKSRR